MNCIDLTSKWSKMLSYVSNYSIPNTAKLQKCIDLTSKRSKMLSYVDQTIPNSAKLQKCSNHDELQRFDVKTIKNAKLQKSKYNELHRFETIPNTAKLQKWSNYDELHRFDVKTIKNVELRWNQNTYKSDQITMNCIDLTSKRSKMLSYVSNYSKHSKTTKVHQFDVKTI